MNDNIHVAIRSYKRAGRVETIKVVPFAKIWVPEPQAEEYEQYYPGKIITIPDECDGNLGRKNNAILDRSPTECLLMLDDDISAIAYWEGGEKNYPDVESLKHFIAQGFELAKDIGVRQWGLNQAQDPMFYNCMRPFSLLAPILGPFVGHLSPELRYDEASQGKDDYDFFLQNILVHRKALRFNKWFYVHAHGECAGGFVSQRTMDVELASVEYMQKKWGKKVFSPGGTGGGKSATGKNILNSRIRITIPGC